jgi:phospholipase C
MPSISDSIAAYAIYDEERPVALRHYHGPMSRRSVRVLLPATLGAALLAVAAGGVRAAPERTATPIHHLVVIFQENVSFDHYFGTYPVAANPPGEPRFTAAPGTPAVEGLTPALLTSNPNGANPFRLDRREAITCDMDHEVAPEQRAVDGGRMDRFVEETGNDRPGCRPETVMGYYDGNTVTALWNYAQHYAMSDNSYGTTFGPSTVGALNLIAGQTHGAMPTDLADASGSAIVRDGTIVRNLPPAYDDCSHGPTIAMTGPNVGDLLNAKGIRWGWFQGGFQPTGTPDGLAVCGSRSKNVEGRAVADYMPIVEPFQFYLSTANPHHLPPSSVARIGTTDQANHQYGLADFWAALDAGHLPAVSFLKAPSAEDGHADFSDPLDEQRFLVSTIDRIARSSSWRSVAIVIAYDDSDGWYDHVAPPLVSPSDTPEDSRTGPGSCGAATPDAYSGRCGYGPRLPLLIISPFARRNFVDHTLTDQSSILRFIEDNWALGRLGDQSFDATAGALDGMFDFTSPSLAAPLLLDPTTGEPITSSHP